MTHDDHRTTDLPGPVLAAISAAVAVVLERPPATWRLRRAVAVAPAPAPPPWAFAGRLALMEGRRWVQSRRTKA
ncbi:MAG TPA: hypothetical protein VIL95_01965 [Bacillota bacterium]